jgi:thiol-disulfide isomerase/thioredoxin
MKNPLSVSGNVIRTTLLLLALISTQTLPAQVQTPPAPNTGMGLLIGDLAPKFQVGKWLQGEPVDGFDTNHVYIVEFWATWCGPCKTSIPHLNDLWQEFKDKGVVVIGVDIWDNDSKVPAFVKKMGDKMTYRVALDDNPVALDDESHQTNGFMAVHWLPATRGNGVPTVFIVNKRGRIAWIGLPWDLDERLLNDILSDHYDLAQAAAKYKKQRQDDRKVADEEDHLYSAVKRKQWDDAGSTLNELVKEFPDLQPRYTLTQFRILWGQKKYNDAYVFANSFSDSHPDDAYWQNMLAYEIVSQDDAQKRNLALALKLAERANTAANGKDANILDNLAFVQFMSGKKSDAVATQQKAVEAAPEEAKPGFRRVLEDFQQGRLPEVK